LDIFFADDSRQERPSRPGMGPFVATGGIYVPGDEVRYSEAVLNKLCEELKFPIGEEFKWSPGRELWMRDNLREEARKEFYLRAFRLVGERGVRAVVVVEDKGRPTATGAESAEDDVTIMLIERVHGELQRSGTHGIIVTDRPSGDRGNENRFLTKCLETLQAGTTYVLPDRIAINVVSTPSKLVRLLQLADVFTSCTTAMVSGENNFAPSVFSEVRKLMSSSLGRAGGYGLKIHPDSRYRNLYYWLLGDTHFVRNWSGLPMPLSNYPYSKGPPQP
jgi:hypothetical protein